LSLLFKKKNTPVVMSKPEAKPLPMLVQVALNIPADDSIDCPVIECSRVLSVYECHQVNLVAGTNGGSDGCYNLCDFFTDNAEIKGILANMNAKICLNGDDLYFSTEDRVYKKVHFIEKLYHKFDGQKTCIGSIIIMNLGMNQN